jgi:hypothetical protein
MTAEDPTVCVAPAATGDCAPAVFAQPTACRKLDVSGVVLLPSEILWGPVLLLVRMT